MDRCCPKCQATSAVSVMLENTEFYTQLLDFESDEWHVTHARNLEEENKLIEVGFEYVRYSEKDDVAIYRNRE